MIETFGAGAGRASLPAGQTTYTYAATGAVNDGSYALVPGIDTSYGGWWHTGPDHTLGDTNGRAMLVNADFAAGKFFSKSFTGLQVGSKYDFSAWITNANNAGSAILPNIKFRVVDPAHGRRAQHVRHRQPPQPGEPDLDPLRHCRSPPPSRRSGSS